VHPSVPARNLAELVAYARANPGKLNNGSLGGGGLVHLLTERFKAAAGIDIVDVAYGGSAAALKDLAGGSIQLYMDGPTLTIPLYKSGQVRILGVSSLRRLAEAPDVPTFREQGFPTITAGNWIALFASAKTPPALLARLQRDAASAMTAPDVRDKIAAGYELWTGTREEFGVFMEQDRAAWEKDLRRLNLPLQDG
jgi:tripartite-type tricarboxylate transporter receptor subunit TctC